MSQLWPRLQFLVALPVVFAGAGVVGCSGAPPAFEPDAVLVVTPKANDLEVRWPVAADDDLKHYAVFVDDKLLTTTAKNQWTVPGSRPWQSVRLRVEAVDANAQRSKPLRAQARFPDTTPPVFGAGLRWNADESALTWTAATDDGELAHIRVILRSPRTPDASDATEKVLAELQSTATTWSVKSEVPHQLVVLQACDAATNCTSAPLPEKPSVRDALAEKRRSALMSKIAGKGLLAMIGTSSVSTEPLKDLWSTGSAFDSKLDVALSGAGISNGGGGGFGAVGSRGGGGMVGQLAPATARAKAATGRLRMRILNVDGIEQKSASRIVRRRLGTLRNCSTSASEKTVVLRVAVSEAGVATSNVKAASGNIELDTCLRQSVSRFRFPKRAAAGAFDLSLQFGS